LTVAKFCFL